MPLPVPSSHASRMKLSAIRLSSVLSACPNASMPLFPSCAGCPPVEHAHPRRRPGGVAHGHAFGARYNRLRLMVEPARGREIPNGYGADFTRPFATSAPSARNRLIAVWADEEQVL